MDVIKFAMQMELDGKKFYEQAAEAAPTKELKDIFLYLAEEEDRHFKFFHSLYRAYMELDASLLEINPLVQTGDGDLLALDAKVSFDDNALYRHPEILELRDENEEDSKELRAGELALSYIVLDGNIGCMVN